MKLEQFRHLVRAIADAAGVDRFVVVGSQAIIASMHDAPEQLLRSIEADFFVPDDPELVNQVDRALGDGSDFHATFGIYAHGVGPETVTAPAGWVDRLVPFEVERRVGQAGTVTADCIEAHDLVLAKLARGAMHDIEFAAWCIGVGIVTNAVLDERLDTMPPHVLEHARSMLAVARSHRP